MSTQHFCSECVSGHDIGDFMNKIWACSREETGSHLDPVDGRRIYKSCRAERSDAMGACGPEGKLWSVRR